ncbi:MAG: Sporulation domain protein [Myxococcaceae bacterium]|nr:Sporulation domain protein [Myxococcaceae bacterium]
MRDLDQLRERRSDSDGGEGGNAGRKLGLFALAGTLSIAAIMSLGVVSGSSGSAVEPESASELDPLSQLAQRSGESAPRAAVTKPAVQLERLSFPATLVGDESTIEATVRAADAEHAALTGRSPVRVGTRARAEDVPASTLATEQSERLSRTAKHDPLVAQAMPERGGAVAPSGSEGAFTLQVVSYETRDTAERFANALRARGHRAFVAQAEVPGRGRSFRVRIGPFATRRDALVYQTSFEHDERMHSILVTSAPK